MAWGVIEGCRWGSGALLWGLGYMVWPGDMVGCMECGMESAKVAVRRVARCDRQVGRGGCHGQAGIGWRRLIGLASVVRGMGRHEG